MKKLVVIIFILILVLLASFTTLVWAAAGTILEPSFETISNWTYSETDADFVDDQRSTTWTTLGTYSYRVSSTANVSVNTYCQILQSIDFTGLDTITFDANLYGESANDFSASVLVGSNTKWTQIAPTTATNYLRQEIDVSGDSGTLDLIFRVTVDKNPSTNKDMIAYFDNIKTWGSYDDSSQTNVWGTVGNPYTVLGESAYMYGRNFESDTYTVAFYDAGGTKVGSDVSATLNGTNLSCELALDTDPLATAGTWNAAVFNSSGSPPATRVDKATISALPGYVIEDDFEVAQSAIPEFPVAITAIIIAVVCFIIYYWIKKRRLINIPTET
ncbi:hypothetical protein ACFLU0_00540 [Chloroflexota bacterium]